MFTLFAVTDPSLCVYNLHFNKKIYRFGCIYELFLTFVGWLITQWSTMADKDEIKEDVALCFGSRLAPHFKHNKIQELLSVSNYLCDHALCSSLSTVVLSSRN